MDTNVPKEKAKPKISTLIAHKRLTQRFKTLCRQGESKGISKHVITRAFRNGIAENVDSVRDKRVGLASGKRNYFLLAFCIGTILSTACFFATFRSVSRKSKCLVDYDDYTREMTRPLVNCNFCKNLHRVPVETSMNQSRFQDEYAYSLVPVVIKGETANWTALNTFNFRFLGDLFNSTEGTFDKILYDCMYHAYQTNFTSLAAVFSMPESRANFTKGETPWYIGWSNCDGEMRQKLRKHYHRPSFLPPNSDVSNVDWFFMGVQGQGALIHVDYIQKASWQAQISGTKTWTLVPPVECEDQCRTLNVTLEKGDILVVETNIWFHSTYVHPGELSIAVGSEYD